MYHLCRSLKVCCCRDIKCQTVTHSQHGWMYPWTLVWTLITMWIAWVCSTVFAVDPRRIGGLFTAGSLLEVGLNRHLNLGRIFASMKRVRIGSDNGLSLIQHQAIILNNARLLSIGPLGTKEQLQWDSNQNTNFSIHGNAYGNIVWQMTDILSRGRWVKWEALHARSVWGWRPLVHFVSVFATMRIHV